MKNTERFSEHTEIAPYDGGWRVTTINNGNAWGVGVTFPTEAAAQSVASAIEAALSEDQEPQPYRCTVLIEMPPDDGHNLRPEDVSRWLGENGAQLIDWHDQDLISPEDRTTDG